MHTGHVDVVEWRERFREELDMTGFGLVVRLGHNVSFELLQQRFRVVAFQLRHGHQRAEPLEVVLDRVLDPRVLDLHGDGLAFSGHGAVHLA